jgi:hypothetical protein
LAQAARGPSPLLVCQAEIGPLLDRAKKNEEGQKPNTPARLYFEAARMA